MRGSSVPTKRKNRRGSPQERRRSRNASDRIGAAAGGTPSGTTAIRAGSSVATAYYECPMLCTLVLNGMTSSLKTISFDPGEDYEVVVISIDPDEKLGIALFMYRL